jgi:putative protein-disulfide isomerase
MRLLYLFFTILSFTHMQAQENAKLIYVGDPMCSWCYGISEELSLLWESTPNLEKEIVLGGLRPGGGDEWNKEFTSFLRHHWEDVAQASGAEFSYALLEKNDFLYDTEPSCRAVVIARGMDSSIALNFFKDVQKKFYYHNEDPKEVDFYQSLCKKYKLDYSTFKAQFTKSSAKEQSTKDFLRARQLGVNSFPTILVEKDGKTQVIARGYAKASDMKRSIDQILK